MEIETYLIRNYPQNFTKSRQDLEVIFDLWFEFAAIGISLNTEMEEEEEERISN